MKEKNFNGNAKQNIRENWLYFLIEFSSVERQKLLWYGNKKNLISSFTELMCGYFDDVLGSDSYDEIIKEGFITIDEYKIIEPFHTALLNYK